MGTELFQTLAPWLREHFARPVHRLALDAGSTCPNRDGTRGLGSSTYCDVEGSGTGAVRAGQQLTEQLTASLKRIARRRREGEPVDGMRRPASDAEYREVSKSSTGSKP